MQARATEVWPVNAPDKLEDRCIAFFLENIKFYLNKTDDSYTLKPGISFPHGLSDKILLRLAQNTKHLQSSTDNVFGIFNNRARTYLTSLPLRYTAVTPEQFQFLCTHPVREIDITHCSSLKAKYVDAINQAAKTLQILKLGGSDQLERLDIFLFGIERMPFGTVIDSAGDANHVSDNGAIFNLPKIQSLSLRDVKTFSPADGVQIENITLLDRMIRPMKSLTHLYLCNCWLEQSMVEGIGDLDLPNLVSLSLCDVLNGNAKALLNLCKLTTLRVLDVSEGQDTNELLPVKYQEPTEHLEKLLTCLPRLTSLDISGTNLAGYLPVQQVTHRLDASGANKQEEEYVNSKPGLPRLTSLDISGTNLAGYLPVQQVTHRLDATGANNQEEEPGGIPGTHGRHFQFLGLFKCADDAAERKNLPADKIAGEANEEQILTALHMYTDKPSLLTRTLDCLFNMFRTETVHRQHCALEGILAGMQRNKHDRHVQIAGSATLFHIANGQQKHNLTQSMKRRILLSLLEAMERHNLEYTMIRNGCLTFSIFKLPDEVLFCYDRLVSIILQIIQSFSHDEFLMRIGIDLLNCLACQVERDRKKTLGALGTVELQIILGRTLEVYIHSVESDRKKMLGALGTVEVMCSIITRKLESQICDVTLQNCWSTLWNITDETDENCDKFMKMRGMFLFLDCFRRFPDRDELLRNMMGLMGNIAEVKELRPDLMNQEYVTVFANFLESHKDGIEVSYNAAGVFAHMLSDSEETWTVDSPTRENVMTRMETAIQRWPLNSNRTINYRSFGPILRLVKCYESTTSQYWAVWALCNLTQVYPEKYCSLLKEEGGIQLLEQLVDDPRPKPAVKLLAKNVIEFVEKVDKEETDSLNVENEDCNGV